MKMIRFCVCEIVVWLNLQLDPLEFQTAISIVVARHEFFSPCYSCPWARGRLPKQALGCFCGVILESLCWCSGRGGEWIWTS